MIYLKGVSKKFNNKVILDNVYFEFNGTIPYLITGESGAGKTTILNIISNYIELDSGELLKDTTSLEYLFQDELLFLDLTVKENIYIKYCAKNKVSTNNDSYFMDILKRLRIDDKADDYVKNLSGGERQRVQLAQVLLFKPDVILMDEPTAKLDRKNKKLLTSLIIKNFNTAIKIIVTHDDVEMYSEKHVLVLEEGKLKYV